MATHKPLEHRKLPPLKTLRGFESTARLLSYRKAAQELSLTHPAISHQIDSLETNLGVKLFIRQGRQMQLSPEGERYYPIVRQALDQLINGSETLRRSGAKKPLKIQTYISVSIRWLSHRLARFRTAYPAIELQLISSIEEQSFDEANADIGLIFCRIAPTNHLNWTPLFTPTLMPVCHPDLVASQTNLCPSKLLNYPLISVTSEVWQWHDWFSSAGIEAFNTAQTILVDSTAIALEMAMDGEGIALINGPFAVKDLKAGRLIQPSSHGVENFGEWGLACRKDMSEQPHIAAFTRWLLQDIKDYQ